MAQVVMLLSNAFRPDPRVEKEANSLAAAGYQVTIIAWDRQAELPAEETLPGGERILRIHSVPTIYGAGARQILRTPRFWSAAIQAALPLEPEIVHCHDLDTLYAGVRLKKRLGCRLVYDAHEDYPSLMLLYLPRFMVAMLKIFERWLVRQADAVLAASSVSLDKLAGLGVHNPTYLPNVPDLASYDAVTPEQVALRRAELGLSPEAYVVGYIGGFTRNRLLLPLVDAVRGLPEVTLLLWGDGHQREALQAAIHGATNIRYLGWLPASQVPLHTRLVDVVYYCLEPGYPGAVFNAPNTLSNAMAAGKPVIANEVGDLGRIVRQTGCGVLIDRVNAQSIGEVISRLEDADLRAQLGSAGRRAAEAEYHWGQVSQRLLTAYHQLLSH